MDYIEKRFHFIYPSELNMYYCGKRERSEHHSYGPAVRDHFLLVYIKEGTAVLTLKGKPYEMTSGQLLFMFPGEKIYYKVNEECKWTILWIGVYGKLVYDFIAPLKITPDNPLYPCPEPEETCNILEEILRASNDHSLSGKLHCLALVYDFFATLSKHVNLSEKNNPEGFSLPGDNANEITYVSDNIAIREAENMIRFHYDSNITVEEIAASVNLEICYFSKLFKKETGMSPKQKINEYRINKACLLLRSSSLTVSEISRCVGINDPQYFARTFKKNTGSTPMAYRNHNNGANNLSRL